MNNCIDFEFNIFRGIWIQGFQQPAQQHRNEDNGYVLSKNCGWRINSEQYIKPRPEVQKHATPSTMKVLRFVALFAIVLVHQVSRIFHFNLIGVLNSSTNPVWACFSDPHTSPMFCIIIIALFLGLSALRHVNAKK